MISGTDQPSFVLVALVPAAVVRNSDLAVDKWVLFTWQLFEFRTRSVNLVRTDKPSQAIRFYVKPYAEW